VIVAGDIGGTKTILALFPGDRVPRKAVFEAVFPSRSYTSLEDVAREFLGMAQVEPHRTQLRAACFGIAGPVVEGKVRTSNLPWVVTESGLSEVFGFQTVFLINDLEAAAYGVLTLEPAEMVCLNPGRPAPRDTRALIAAGTGLGEALIFCRGGEDFVPMPSEGGHADFAPRTDREIELLRFLRRQWDHVSYERVLSGPGLMNIYRFLRHQGAKETPSVEAAIEEAEDSSAAVSQAALEGTSETCAEALRIFVSIYGAEAGNLGLKSKSTGGVYVGGGIAPKIRSWLEGGLFMEAFLNKGRMRPLMESMPVHLVLNPRTALLGAADFARRRVAGA
jgi:glucokinase